MTDPLREKYGSRAKVLLPLLLVGFVALSILKRRYPELLAERPAEAIGPPPKSVRAEAAPGTSDDAPKSAAP